MRKRKFIAFSDLFYRRKKWTPHHDISNHHFLCKQRMKEWAIKIKDVLCHSKTKQNIKCCGANRAIHLILNSKCMQFHLSLHFSIQIYLRTQVNNTKRPGKNTRSPNLVRRWADELAHFSLTFGSRWTNVCFPKWKKRGQN